MYIYPDGGIAILTEFKNQLAAARVVDTNDVSYDSISVSNSDITYDQNNNKVYFNCTARFAASNLAGKTTSRIYYLTSANELLGYDYISVSVPSGYQYVDNIVAMSVYTINLNSVVMFSLTSEHVTGVVQDTNAITLLPIHTCEIYVYPLAVFVDLLLASDDTVACFRTSEIAYRLESLKSVEFIEEPAILIVELSNHISTESATEAAISAAIETTLTTHSDVIPSHLAFIKQTPICTTYGRQFTEELPELATDLFLSDFYAFKFISREAKITRNHALNVVVAISNLLRLCDIYTVNEVFLGSIRLKKPADKNYWVIVEY